MSLKVKLDIVLLEVLGSGVAYLLSMVYLNLCKEMVIILCTENVIQVLVLDLIFPIL